ncbi:hypothetical protein B484DRAFT_245616, partial [Ochromonadaceae sp. CCMP2298]
MPCGSAHIEFLTSQVAAAAVTQLQKVLVQDRVVSFELKNGNIFRKTGGRITAAAFAAFNRDTEEGGASAGGAGGAFGGRDRGMRVMETQSGSSTIFASDSEDVSSWTTVYVGGLPYKITDEQLKNVIESRIPQVGSGICMIICSYVLCFCIALLYACIVVLYSGMLLWYYGIMVLWYYCIMVLWYYGIMVLWYYGIMVLWYYGIMVLWYY